MDSLRGVEAMRLGGIKTMPQPLWFGLGCSSAPLRKELDDVGVFRLKRAIRACCQQADLSSATATETGLTFLEGMAGITSK